MKSIYEIFNNVKIDTSEYDNVVLSEIEKKRIKNLLLKKAIVKKKPSNLKLVSSIAILIIGGTILFNSPSAIAKIPIVGGLLEQYLISNDEHNIDLSSLEPYKTVIGQANTNEFGTMELNEVLLDEGRLFISSTVHGSAAKDVSPFPTLQIDGKEIAEGGSSKYEIIDEKTYIYMTSMIVSDISLDDEHHIKLSYNLVNDQHIDAPWTFEFKASGELLAVDVSETEINQALILSNGQQVLVEKIVQSPVSITLYYKMKGNIESWEYDVQFKAYNEDGGELPLNGASTMGKDSHIRFYTNLEKISSITLIPFYTSGFEGNRKNDIYVELPEKAIKVDLKQ